MSQCRRIDRDHLPPLHIIGLRCAPQCTAEPSRMSRDSQPVALVCCDELRLTRRRMNMTPNSSTSLRLRVVDNDQSVETLELDAWSLQEELLELGVNDVKNVSTGTPPPGARGMDVSSVGQLLIDFVNQPELLSAIVGVVTGWLSRSADRSAELDINGNKIRVDGASSAAQRRLINAWISQVSAESQE